MGDNDIGKHGQMMKLWPAIYDSRPPVAVCTRAWDPAVVLNPFRPLENETISLLQLGQLRTLIGLCSMLRCGEVAQMPLKSIPISELTMSFSSLKPRKSQRASTLRDFLCVVWIQDPLQ